MNAPPVPSVVQSRNGVARVLFLSRSRRIGLTDWRVGVGEFPHLIALGCGSGLASFYEFRTWDKDEFHWYTDHPQYDSDDSTSGLPARLSDLYRDNLAEINAAFGIVSTPCQLLLAGVS